MICKRYRKYLKPILIKDVVNLDEYEEYKEKIEIDIDNINKVISNLYYCWFVNNITVYASDTKIYNHKTNDNDYLLIVSTSKYNCYIRSTTPNGSDIHHGCLPAIIIEDMKKCHNNVRSYQFEHLKHNISHREYGPQCIAYKDDILSDGKHVRRRTAIVYKQNDAFHCDKHPATIYIINDVPALCTFYINGDMKYRVEYDNGLYKYITRKYNDEISILAIYEKGFRKREAYTNDNLYHRLDGPAVIDYVKNIKYWYYQNKQIPDNIIKIENGKFDRQPTTFNIVQAMLYNREYGMYIKSICDEKCK